MSTKKIQRTSTVSPAVPGSASSALHHWQGVNYLRVDPIRLASFAHDKPLPAAASPTVVDPANFGDGAKRMLIVGLGDENQGDCGIGSYLVRCLGQYTWPEGVDFCHLREISWERINDYSKIILLDAMHGPERPGSVYQADGEALMACSANHHRHSIEPFLALRRRLMVFGIQPHSRGQGRQLSPRLVDCLPGMLIYLRHYILRAAAELTQVN